MILPPNHLALKGNLRPPVMAIGDSMFNGVRSLTIHAPPRNREVEAERARARAVRRFG